MIWLLCILTPLSGWFVKSTREWSVFQFNCFSPECWQKGRIIHCREEATAWGQRERAPFPCSFSALPVFFSARVCRRSDPPCARWCKKRVNVAIMYQIDVLWVMQTCGIYLLLLFMLNIKCVPFFLIICRRFQKKNNNMTWFSWGWSLCVNLSVGFQIDWEH